MMKDKTHPPQPQFIAYSDIWGEDFLV